MAKGRECHAVPAMAYPISLSSDHTSGRRMVRRRVSKACDRCRLKKSKCNGQQPCERCKLDKTICQYKASQKPRERVVPKGYVEMLERQQVLLVRALQKLHRGVGTVEDYPMDEDPPTAHEILAKLEILNRSFDNEGRQAAEIELDALGCFDDSSSQAPGRRESLVGNDKSSGYGDHDHITTPPSELPDDNTSDNKDISYSTTTKVPTRGGSKSNNPHSRREQSLHHNQRSTLTLTSTSTSVSTAAPPATATDILPMSPPSSCSSNTPTKDDQLNTRLWDYSMNSILPEHYPLQLNPPSMYACSYDMQENPLAEWGLGQSYTFYDNAENFLGLS